MAEEIEWKQVQSEIIGAYFPVFHMQFPFAKLKQSSLIVVSFDMKASRILGVHSRAPRDLKTSIAQVGNKI